MIVLFKVYHADEFSYSTFVGVFTDMNRLEKFLSSITDKNERLDFFYKVIEPNKLYNYEFSNGCD